MKVAPMKFGSQQKLRPPALKEGDTVGVVAPAGPFDKDAFEAGVGLIRDMGFEVRIDARVFERCGYLAGGDRQRAALVNEMMADSGVQAVVCARGGYGVLRILEHLDYRTIAGHAKLLMGFSDITALHQALQLKTGLITFHGPMVTTLARGDKNSLRAWRDSLMGARNFSIGLDGLRVLKAGSAEGILTGGNLATLCHLVATPFGADYAGTVLMIEDVGEAPYRIDRMLTQMLMAGVLDGIAGLVVGRFEDCGTDDEINALILERFGNLDIPIVSGAPVGHGDLNLPLPLGVKVRLDTIGNGLSVLESVFQ